MWIFMAGSYPRPGPPFIAGRAEPTGAVPPGGADGPAAGGLGEEGLEPSAGP